MRESDLVMLRLPLDPEYQGRQRHYTTWFRVKFIDNDGTFIGEVERKDRNLERYKKGEQVKLNIDKVLGTYKEGQEFCYKDNVTVCECPGLCRNNY